MIEVNRSDTFENWRLKCNQAFLNMNTDNERIDALEALVAELLQKIGDLTSLHTTVKTSLVDAVNEVNDRVDAL